MKLFYLVFLSFISLVSAASRNRTLLTSWGQSLTYQTYLDENDVPHIRGTWNIAVRPELKAPGRPGAMPVWKDRHQIRVCMEIGTRDNHLNKRLQVRWVKSVTDKEFETKNVETSRSLKPEYPDDLRWFCGKD